MARGTKVKTGRTRVPVREEKRPVAAAAQPVGFDMPRAQPPVTPAPPIVKQKEPVMVPIKQAPALTAPKEEEVVSLASPFDTAQDAFAPEVIAEDSPRNQEPFNIQTFWDTLYQTAAPTVEQTGRLAMNPNDPNFGNLATGRSEQGFEDLVYTPFHEELQAQGIPLYQVDEEGNRLYINLPQGVSSIPQSERSQEFHPELFDRFGNYLEGTWEDVSGGTAGIGEYSRKFVETPDYDFFEDVLSDPRIGLFANLVPGGTLALTGAKAAAGMDVSPVEIATSLMQGLDIAGVIEPPSVTALPSGQAGPPVPNAGTGLFGTTYAQTQTALNVAAAGDVEGAALALVGQPLINRGLDAVGLDQATIEGAGIQYDDLQEGIGRAVAEVAGGAELDEALAAGVGKYISEGGTLGADLPDGSNIDLGVIEDVVRDVVRPIGEVGTAIADFVENAVDNVGVSETVKELGRNLDDQVLQPIKEVAETTGSTIEDVVRTGGSAVDDAVIQPIREVAKDVDDAVIQPVGDALSTLDTTIREVAPGVEDFVRDVVNPLDNFVDDIELPDVDLPNMSLPDVSISLPGLGQGLGLLGAALMSQPATATTNKLFDNELFKFKTEIGITDRDALIDIEDFLTSPFESSFAQTGRF